MEHQTHSCRGQCKGRNGQCKKHFPKPYCEATEWVFIGVLKYILCVLGGMRTQSIRRTGGAKVSWWRTSMERRLPIKTWSHTILSCFESIGATSISKCALPSIPSNTFSNTSSKVKSFFVFFNISNCFFRYGHGSARGWNPWWNERRNRTVSKSPVKFHKYFRQHIKINFRSIGALEAMWRIFTNPLHDQMPKVLVNRIHLEEKQSILFQSAADLQEQLNHPRQTELMGFFAHNLQQKGKYVLWNWNESLN